jgi:hypothetical protein
MSDLSLAVDALNHRLVLADAIGDAMDAASGNNAPPWVYVFREQVEAIRQAAEVVETLIARGVA